MFMSFEASKRVCLYINGYTSSPWKDTPIPGIDQSLKPSELKEFLAKQK